MRKVLIFKDISYFSFLLPLALVIAKLAALWFSCSWLVSHRSHQSSQQYSIKAYDLFEIEEKIAN